MTEINQCNVCQKRTVQKCGGCQNVFYCSKEHQKADWKKHKGHCQPFKVSSNSTIGRHLLATRDLTRNEIILKEKPLIYGPAEESVPVCLGCHQEISAENYRPCSKCGWPMCNLACENKPCHLPECHYTVKSGEKISIDNFGTANPFYQCITVLRCLYQRRHNSKIWDQLNKLESHCQERSSSQRYYNEKLMATELIQKFFKLESDFSVEEIIRVCGIILVNAHEVPLSEPPYIAIYEKTSMFENDCSSNCSKSFTTTGEILITSGVPIGKGDHLSICYADPLWTTNRRRVFLNETKFFWCCCKRCLDPTEFGTYSSAVSCQNGKCDGLLLPMSFLNLEENGNWNCNKCNYSVANLLVQRLSEKLESDILNLDKGNAAQCNNFLNKLRKVLPPNNCYLVEIKLALSQLIGQMTSGGLCDISYESLNLKLSLCKELVDLTKRLVPSEKRVRGLLLFELHACFAELARRKSRNLLEMEQSKLILEESRVNLVECIDLLSYEPEVLPEGQICAQARRNLHHINKLLHNK